MPRTLGKHLLVELLGCDRALLDDEPFLRTLGAAAAKAMGASVLAVHSHRFDPVGVSVMVVLAESHLALHTWPEHGAASGDIFVCSDATDPARARTLLADGLRAARVVELEVDRGRIDLQSAQRWHRVELAPAQ